MENNAILQIALKTLKIPANINVKLVKSKRAPIYSTIVTYSPNKNKQSIFDYVIEYRKSLSPDLLRHELCHLKLHLMDLPTVESVINQPMNLKSQVLSTLHEDYYSNLIMYQKFSQSFSTFIMRGLSDDHHEIHIHEKIEESQLAWVLQNYILKLVLFEFLGYKKEAEKIKEKIEHIGEESNLQLSQFFDAISDLLRRLPPLPENLRQFTDEEKDSISRIVQTISSIEIHL